MLNFRDRTRTGVIVAVWCHRLRYAKLGYLTRILPGTSTWAQRYLWGGVTDFGKVRPTLLHVPSHLIGLAKFVEFPQRPPSLVL